VRIYNNVFIGEEGMLLIFQLHIMLRSIMYNWKYPPVQSVLKP